MISSRRRVLPLGLVSLLIAAALVNCRGDSGQSTGAGSDDENQRPNILLILADDLGFSDLGFLGSEIRTPNLDALAASGVVLTNYHTAPACSPTRAMLLTGVDAHPAGLGTMSGDQDINQQGQPGYEAHLSDRVVTVASLLRDAGYATSMAGKWHLGGGGEQDAALRPDQRGFDRSFALFPGGASHFGDAQPLGNTPPPARYREDGEVVESLPEDFFSSDFYTDKLIEYIDEANEQGRPFFTYAAYTAPHWPLQATEEYIDRYAAMYDEGWDVLAQRRLRGLEQAGIIQTGGDVPAGLPWVPRWDELDDDQRRVSAREMELFAAMVDNLDANIGRLLDHLRDIGEYDNTFILFSSDNGAEGNAIYDVGWSWKDFDNSLANMGRVGSYVVYNTGWAQAATAPFRLFKSFPSEGGTRLPAIVHLPGDSAVPRHDNALATVKDFTPTALELAGIEHPGNVYEGRTVARLEGRSLLPFLRGDAAIVHPPGYAMGWELFGRRGLLSDGWKLLWVWEPYGAERWRLYNLAQDPGEQNDLADQEPARLQKMLRLWDDYVSRNGVILPTRDMSYARPADGQ